MTIPIEKQFRDYRQKLADWVRRKGLAGGGGSYDAHKRIYNPMPEPTQPAATDWEKKAFDAVRAEVLKKAAV